MTEEQSEKKYVGRGGPRGGGRPTLENPEDSQKRPAHGMRAWPEEWKLIKRFQKCVQTDIGLSEKSLEVLEKECLTFRIRQGMNKGEN